MSAFLGVARLGPGGIDPEAPVLPDQALLGPPRVWIGQGAVLSHRQHVNTPEDKFETQPTPAWGGWGAILFDGRLDDRAGLCGELGIAPREPLPDSELVARAFEKWGTDAPSKLTGDFAIAAWDGRNRLAILCADPNGNRPLYFHRSGDLLSFSTVLPALLAAPGIPCELDESVIANLLFNNFENSRGSFFRGINRVLGGTTLTLSSSGENIAHYWRPDRRRRLILRRDEEYVEAAREILDRAVASRLRSLAPVPVMGSGGIDSSCLIVSVSGLTNTAAIPLFTAVPEADTAAIHRRGKYADERTPIAAMQAAFPRLAPCFIEPAAVPDMEFAPERIFEAVAAPLFNIVATGFWETTFGPMRARGATSCLAGHTGNTTLSWDGQIGLSSLFRHGRWIRMATEASALAGHRLLPTARSILSAALGPYIPPSFRGDRWRKEVALHPLAEARFSMLERLRASGDMRFKIPRDGTELRLVGLTSRRALLAETQAWARARHGIETRDPFDDVRLIDFCLSIPEDQFLRHGQTRWLARRLLRTAGVPAQITENNCRGAWHPESVSRRERRRQGLDLEIACLRASHVAARLLDLDRLTRLAAVRPPAATDGSMPDFYPVLVRSLHIGAFIRWAETRASAGGAVENRRLTNTPVSP